MKNRIGKWGYILVALLFNSLLLFVDKGTLPFNLILTVDSVVLILFFTILICKKFKFKKALSEKRYGAFAYYLGLTILIVPIILGNIVYLIGLWGGE